MESPSVYELVQEALDHCPLGDDEDSIKQILSQMSDCPIFEEVLKEWINETLEW